MQVNENEMRVAVDVDGTLIHTPSSLWQIQDTWIKVKDPYTNTIKYVIPNNKHIELLKTQKIRGFEVTVHSANGWAWAKTIIEALKLTEYVDKVETKYVKYIDDLSADDWMERIYLGPADEFDYLSK